MKKFIVIVISAFLLLLTFSHESDATLYKYTDKNGNIGYTDNLQSVPEDSREKAVIVKALPESIVKKSDEPAGERSNTDFLSAIKEQLTRERIASISSELSSMINLRLAGGIAMAILLLIIFIFAFTFIWRRNKKRISLVLRKNKITEGKKHTGQFCMGFEACPYPESIQKIDRYERNHIGGISNFEHRFCNYRKSDSSVAISSSLSMEDYDKLITENSLCYHPSEFKPAEVWKCYKCNSVVSSDRERHC